MSFLILDLESARDSPGMQLSRLTGWPIAPIEWRTFEDGEYKLRPMVDVRDQRVVVVARTSGDIHNRLIALALLLSALARQQAAHVSVVLPCLPYARKDRVTQPRDPLSLQWLAGMLQMSGMHALWTFESHQPAATENAFRLPVHGPAMTDWILAQADRDPEVARHLETMDVVVSPDAGGVRRAQALRESLAQRTGRQIQFALLDKHRSAGRIAGDPNVVGEVAGLKALVVDDLVSTGATLSRAASALYRAGALEVHGLMAHGLPSRALVQSLRAARLRSLMLSDSQARSDLEGVACKEQGESGAEQGESGAEQGESGAEQGESVARAAGMRVWVLPVMPAFAAQMTLLLGAAGGTAIAAPHTP